MTAPNVIFVDDLAVVNDSVTKISIHSLPNFSEYIRKDALLEWLEGRMTMEGATEGFVGGYDFALKDVINKINSM